MKNQLLEDLKKKTEQPGPQAWEAFKQFSTLGTEESLSMLFEKVSNHDWTIRQAALNAIAEHKLGYKAEPILRKLMKDGSEYVVRAALAAAGKLRLTSLNEDVAAHLKDRNCSNREAAVRAIGQMWTSVNFDLVYALFLKDGDEAVQKEAAWSLYLNVDKDNWRTLYKSWISAVMPRYRLWAIELVLRFGNESDMSTLSSLTSDPNGHVRKAVENALVFPKNKTKDG